MKFKYVNSLNKRLRFSCIVIALMLFANIFSLKNKSTFLNKNKNTASTIKSSYEWLLKENQNWAPVEITLTKKTEKIVLNTELIFKGFGIFFATNSQQQLEKIQTNLKNYVSLHPVDDKNSYLIDFGNLQSCEFVSSNNVLSFDIRVFGGSENAKYCEVISTSIRQLPNEILTNIQKIKDACKIRKKNILKNALMSTLVERQENFISEELKKGSKYKEAAEQLILIKDKFEKIKKFSELKQRILDENKETITEITNSVNEEISKQIILPQEINLLGPKIIIPNVYLIQDPNLTISISAMKVQLSKGNVVYVSDFKNQTVNYLNSVNDEKKGYLIANVNYILMPIEKVEFTISLEVKDGKKLSKPLECKAEAAVSLPRSIKNIDKNRFYMQPVFECPEIVNGRDYYLDY